MKREPNSLRAVIAILFAAVLVLAESVGAGTADLATAKSECRPCACAARTCCVGKSAPARMPAPAAPANSLSLRQHQSMLPPTLLVRALAVPPVAQNLPGFFSLVSSEGIPLYRRNCAFLI